MLFSSLAIIHLLDQKKECFKNQHTLSVPISLSPKFFLILFFSLCENLNKVPTLSVIKLREPVPHFASTGLHAGPLSLPTRPDKSRVIGQSALSFHKEQ